MVKQNSLLKLVLLGVGLVALTAGSAQAQTNCFTAYGTTLSNWLGHTCVLGDATNGYVTYTWNAANNGGYSCNSTPASICTTNLQASSINMGSDSMGEYTILVGQTAGWNISTNGDHVTVVIKGTVYGTSSNQSWPHWNGLDPGQTGTGVEDNKVTVDCSSSGMCTNSLNGVSDIDCDAANHSGVECNEQMMLSAYNAYLATYTQNTSSNPYDLTIQISLTAGSGTGTANLYSVGTHLKP
jgi:hypothetical protein